MSISLNLEINMTIEQWSTIIESNIFTTRIDQQLQELNARFNEQAMELLSLVVVLNPREHYSFNIENICTLVRRFSVGMSVATL
jgi:hypothetical protein